MAASDQREQPSILDCQTDANEDSCGVGDEAENTANINNLSIKMFEKVSEYLEGELSTTLEDYKLLEEMNRITITKYSDMKQIAANVSKSLKELHDKYKDLRVYLEQIDHIEENVTKLEQAAYKLDAYSKRLESKFKHLEKR